MIQELTRAEKQDLEAETLENTLNGENHNSGMMKTTNQEFPESQFQNGENHHSRIVEITKPEYPKSQSNNTDINKTDISETEINQSYPIMSGNLKKKRDVMEEMRKSDQWEVLYICDTDPEARDLARRKSPTSRIVADEQVVFEERVRRFLGPAKSF